MTDCGETRYFLGVRIDYNRAQGVMKLTQESAAVKFLDKFGLSQCNPTHTPMEKGLQLTREGTPTNHPYRELLGSIMYQMLCVRPDICYPVSYMGRFQQNPTDTHWTSLKRIARYMKGTTTMGLTFKRAESNTPLIGYVDADWATDIEDRKSVTGYLFKVYGSSVSWASRKQATVSTSSSEAEYVALSAAVSEAIWLGGILEDLRCKQPDESIVIYEDNRGCIGLAKNPESKRVKHIDIKHHFIRDHVAAGTIKIQPIPTAEQQADLFTKAPETTRFQYLRALIGVSN